MSDETARIAVGILNISHRHAEADERSSKRVRELLSPAEYRLVEYALVPDEVETIRVTLRDWAARCDVVLTIGGTGLATGDVTPEATRSVLDRECPGIAEAIRAAAHQKRPAALLSRGMAGTIGSCLVVNLPGSTEATQDGVEILLPILAEAVAMIKSRLY